MFHFDGPSRTQNSRTGPMEHKVRPIQISAPKDIYGRPVRFSEGYLDGEASETEVLLTVDGAPSSNFVIAISKDQLWSDLG